MKRLFLLVVVSLLSSALLACVTPSPIPMGANTGRYGYIAEGTRLGVEVGANRDDARAAVTQEGFILRGSTVCGRSLQMQLPCQSGETFDIYYKEHRLGWDWVYLRIADGRVQAIGWSFGQVGVDS